MSEDSFQKGRLKFSVKNAGIESGKTEVDDNGVRTAEFPVTGYRSPTTQQEFLEETEASVPIADQWKVLH